MSRPNCNSCNRNCPYSFKFKLPSGKVITRRGMMKNEKIYCNLHQPPKRGWRLVELALKYPQGLHDALSKLPFDVNLGMYL